MIAVATILKEIDAEIQGSPNFAEIPVRKKWPGMATSIVAIMPITASKGSRGISKFHLIRE